MAIDLRALGAAALGACLLLSAGCSGPSEAEGAAAEGSARSRRADNVSDRTDLPPADYVRYRCDACSCSVFMGDAAACSRPSCKHHWSHHVRRFQ